MGNDEADLWYWITVTPDDAKLRRKCPAWAMSAALHLKTDTVFIPAALAGAEKMVFLAAGWDNMPAVLENGHLYVPAPWVAREFPEIRETCEKIERRVRGRYEARSDDE